MRSLRTRILTGIAAPAILILGTSCATVYLWVRARALADLDRSLEVRAAAMAALVDVDGAVWDVEFDREDLPVGELFGPLAAYEVHVADNGALLARRGLDEPGTVFAAAAPYVLEAPPAATDRPLALETGIDTVVLPSGRELRTWTGVYLVRADGGEAGEEAHSPLGAPPVSDPVVRIAVAQDLAPVRADLATLLGTQVATGVVLSAIALASGWVLSRRIVAPIQAIARRAAAVTAPTPDAPLQKVGTGDEIDRLVDALNESYLRLHGAYLLQGRFTADASHELRTPIAVIRSHAEVALRHPRPAEEYEAVLEAVLAGTTRVEGVLEGLLLLARADAGGQAGREPVALLGVAEEVVAELPEDGPAVRVGGDDVHVFADPVQIELVLRNLLSNAVRHTPPSGEVRVHVAIAGDDALLEVADTGEGIPADALPHVFERFFRADDARSRDRGGAGLGLSIVRTVVERHGGTVTIESEPGRGTTVRVRLPRASVRAREAG